MATEIERKFLVKGDGWRHGAVGERIRQGYLANGEISVRVRTVGARGYLTVKGKSTGASRAEFEYEVPPADAEAMLALCPRPLIEKTRHAVPGGRHTFEVDLFEGENAGLVMAEVELDAEDEAVDLPDWIGREVTGDVRFYNAALARIPFDPRWLEEG